MIERGCWIFIGLYEFHLKGHNVISFYMWVLILKMEYTFLVFTVSEIKSKKTCKLFVKILFKELKISKEHPSIIMSDGMKRIISVVKSMLPNLEHKICIWHMYKNYGKQEKWDKLSYYFWMTMRVTTVPKLQQLMQELKNKINEFIQMVIFKTIKVMDKVPL